MVIWGIREIGVAYQQGEQPKKTMAKKDGRNNLSKENEAEVK